MRRVVLPPELTSDQVEQLFVAIIQLDPRKECAVRLRLQGQLYREVVGTMNQQNPDENPVNKMWVQRGCGRAENQLRRFLLYRDRLNEGRSKEKRRDVIARFNVPHLYTPAEQVFTALANAGNKMTSSRKKGRSEEAGKQIYQCRCGSQKLVRKLVNKGGHRNICVHVCTNCGAEYDKESLFMLTFYCISSGVIPRSLLRYRLCYRGCFSSHFLAAAHRRNLFDTSGLAPLGISLLLNSR